MTIGLYIGVGLILMFILLKVLNTSSGGKKKYLDTTNWRDKDLLKYYQRYKNLPDKSKLAPNGKGEKFFNSIIEEIEKRNLTKN